MRLLLAIGYLAVTVVESTEVDFKKFDLNGDGLIDPQEVRTVYRGELSQEDMHDFWNAVDTNGAGAFNKEQ